MNELRDSVVQLMPLILAVIALLIPTAAERLKNRSNPPTKQLPVVQGQPVDFSREYVESVKERDTRQEARILEMEQRLAKCQCGAAHSPP